MPEQWTIAVVDADVAFRSVVARALESLGHRVVEATTGQSLAASVSGVDALIIDPLVAPVAPSGRQAQDPGLDLLLRLKRQAPSLPIAVMSADARVELVVRTMRLGVVDYVTKPADRTRLLLAATRLVEARTQSDASLGLASLPALKDIEKQLIERALVWNRGQVARTARMLGIGRATLYRKLGEMGHPLPRGGKRGVG